jgi:hypothetical protein
MFILRVTFTKVVINSMNMKGGCLLLVNDRWEPIVNKRLTTKLALNYVIYTLYGNSLCLFDKNIFRKFINEEFNLI